MHAVLHLHWLLERAGVRDRVAMLWNAKNSFGFERIPWDRLARAEAITTVSRYMKYRMWPWSVDPLVIPNGLPDDAFHPPSPRALADLSRRFRDRTVLTKMARWDPDKRWIGAIGIVGLETMAAGRIACTGCSGEEYAVPGQNAMVLETNDPREFLAMFQRLRTHPREAQALRRAGRRTARQFAWSEIMQRVLLPRIELTYDPDSPNYPAIRSILRALPPKHTRKDGFIGSSRRRSPTLHGHSRRLTDTQMVWDRATPGIPITRNSRWSPGEHPPEP